MCMSHYFITCPITSLHAPTILGMWFSSVFNFYRRVWGSWKLWSDQSSDTTAALHSLIFKVTCFVNYIRFNNWILKYNILSGFEIHQMIWSHFHQVMYFTELYCVYIVINGYPNSQTFYPHRSTSCQEAGLYSCEELHYYLVQKVMLHISFFVICMITSFLTILLWGGGTTFFFSQKQISR